MGTKIVYGYQVDEDLSFRRDFLPGIKEQGDKIQIGYKPEPEDPQDFTIATVEEKLEVPLFSERPIVKTDHTDQMTAVRDQSYEGTCVGFASGAVKEFQEKRERAVWAKIRGEGDLRIIAPRFIYFKAREPYGWDNATDQGAYIRDAWKVLYNYGAIIESGWPYVPNDWASTPDSRRIADSPRYKVISYVRLNTTGEMVQWLATSGPFVAGIDCFEGLFNTENGVVPDPSEGEYVYGGHAIAIVGFDPDGFGKIGGPAFKFKNSWSSEWGDGGYGYLSESYLHKYSHDNWGGLDLITTKQIVSSLGR